MSDVHDHSKLERAIESKWAMILARFVTPALVSITLGMGAVIGNTIVGEIKSLRAQMLSYQKEIGDVKTEQARIDERLKFHGELFGGLDRRLEKLEDSGRKISDRRSLYSVRGL